MITLIEMAKKRNDMSHDECIGYYREKHSPWAKRLLANYGLEKYTAYYVDKAYSMVGGALPELPWDLIVTKWYTDEAWKSFENWKKTDPEGIKLMEDLGNFLDIEAGMMFECQENVIVSPERNSAGVEVIDYATKKSNVSHEECINYHRKLHAPKVADILGSKLKKYAAYYIDNAFSLAKGVMVTRPFDLITITQLSEEFLKGIETRHNPEDAELEKDEDNFIESKSGVIMICKNGVIIS